MTKVPSLLLLKNYHLMPRKVKRSDIFTNENKQWICERVIIKVTERKPLDRIVWFWPEIRSNDLIPTCIDQGDSQSKECKKHWPPSKIQLNVFNENLFVRPLVLVNFLLNTARFKRNLLEDFFFPSTHNSPSFSLFPNTNNIILSTCCYSCCSCTHSGQAKAGSCVLLTDFSCGKCVASRGYITLAHSNTSDKWDHLQDSKQPHNCSYFLHLNDTF